METKPFQFAVVEHMACYYCDTSGSNQEMFEHQAQAHPDETSIIITGANGKCAFCPYDGDALIEHFEIEHINFKLQDFKPIEFDDDTLNWLLQLDVRKMCDKTNTDHAMTSSHSVVVKANQVDHLICSCQTKVENYTDHITSHALDIHCTKCSFETQDLIELVKHDSASHGMNSINFRCIQFAARLEQSYWSTKMVFKNGFVADMQQLKNTMLDNSMKFEQFIEILVAQKKDFYNRTMKIDTKSQTIDNQSIDTTNQMTKQHGKSVTATTCTTEWSRQSLNEQYELRKQREFINQLFIHGLPFKNGEHLLDIVLSICKAIGANVTSNDIVKTIRPIMQKRIVIVQFRNHNTTLHVLECRSNVPKLMLGQLSEHYTKSERKIPIQFEWFTRPYFRKLMKTVRLALKNQRIHSYRWTTDGLFVQRNRNSRGKYVLNERQFNDYIK